MKLSTAIKSALKAVLPLLFTDDKLTVSATYKVFTGYNGDSAVYTSHKVTALLLEDIVETVQGMESTFNEIRKTIFIRRGELPTAYAFENALQDRLLIGGKEYTIQKAEPILDEMISIEVTG